MAFQAQAYPMTSVSASPDSALGTIHKVPGGSADRVVYRVTSDGVPYAIDRASSFDLPAGLIDVTIPANSGDQLWTYVKNNSGDAILRGQAVSVEDGESAALCERATSAVRLKVVGVAQHNIAAGSHGWILSRGVGQILVAGNADTSEGNQVQSSATAGQVEAGTTNPIAVALEDGPGISDPAGLIQARILCEVVR